MASRLFEKDDHARCYQQYRVDYSINTEFDGEIMSFLREKLPKNANSTAVDVACGTGFLTRVLARHFPRVVGVDCSEAQIKVARDNTPHGNVEYRVGIAEDLLFTSAHSVDLISVALGIHYLNTEKFYEEVDRVLKPGGILVLINVDQGPGTKMFFLRPHIGVPETIKACQATMDEIMDGIILKRTSETMQTMLATGVFPAPVSYEHRRFSFPAEKVGDISIFSGFVSSLGTMRAYMEAHPEEGDVIEVYQNRLLALLREVSTSPATVQLSIGSQFQCGMYRKPLLPAPTH